MWYGCDITAATPVLICIVGTYMEVAISGGERPKLVAEARPGTSGPL